MSLPSDGFEALVDRLAEGLMRAANRPTSAAEWLTRRPPELSVFARVIENEKECDCGGKDGVIVSVPKSDRPTIRGLVLVSSFSHHQRDSATSAFLTTEEAKQLVNTLGEAIALAELELAAAAAGGVQ